MGCVPRKVARRRGWSLTSGPAAKAVKRRVPVCGSLLLRNATLTVPIEAEQSEQHRHRARNAGTDDRAGHRIASKHTKITVGTIIGTDTAGRWVGPAANGRVQTHREGARSRLRQN